MIQINPSHSSDTPRHKTTVCTLFEGNDLPGACGLANSLVAHGFTGTLVLGTRANAPWKEQLLAIADAAQKDERLTCEVLIHEIETDMHFTNYKPRIMLDLLADIQSPSLAENDAVVYFDPDILVNADWDFFEQWIRSGIAISADIAWSALPAQHPHRHAWIKHAEAMGYTIHRNMDIYYNGGFCGLRREDAEFLEIWERLVHSAKEQAGGLDRFRAVPRTVALQSANQDTMNLAAMIWKGELSALGPNGMAFDRGFNPMGHALGRPKPWDKKYVLRSITRGAYPRAVDVMYWNAADGPFQPYSERRVSLSRLDLKASKLISRFIKEN